MSIKEGLYHFDVRKLYRFCTLKVAMDDDEIGQKKLADPGYTVMAAWGLLTHPRGNELIALDAKRMRLEGPESLHALKAFHAEWKFVAVVAIDSADRDWFDMARKEGIPIRDASTTPAPEDAADDTADYHIDADPLARVYTHCCKLMKEIGRAHV